METLDNQPCPFCNKKKLSLIEDVTEVPYFGKTYLFSMRCEECDFKKADVEAEKPKDPLKTTYEVKSDKDMSIRVVKSSYATVKIPQLRMEMSPGPASIGFITNIEGVLNKFKEVIESEKEIADDDADKTKCKNLLKKIWKIKRGDIPIKIVIEDPTGNSAIISDKAIVEKLKVKKSVD